MAPGSISNDAREIFQEGLRLPAVKLIERGKLIQSVMDIMTVNSRLPDYLRGDLWAGIAAARLGEKRILEVVHKYGTETFIEAIRAFMDYGEQTSLRALAVLPKGRFTLEEEQDNGVVYKVAIEITDQEFIVDLSDNPDQDPGPNNNSHDGSVVSAQVIFKNATDPEVVANAGTFRPLRLITRPGSVFAAKAPAAFATYSEVDIRLYDLLWRCLAEHGVAELPAGGLRLDLRHVHRGPSSRNRRALHDHRAAGRGLGRRGRARWQQRAFQRNAWRHLQLPGRGRRGALRAVRGPVGPRRGSRRRG